MGKHTTPPTKGIFWMQRSGGDTGAGIFKAIDLNAGGKLWYMDETEAKGEVWGVSFLHLLICTQPRAVHGESRSLWARHGGVWDCGWGMEQDKHMDSPKVLHGAKDSGVANPARLSTSSPHCATSCFTSPSQAVRHRQENTPRAFAR